MLVRLNCVRSSIYTSAGTEKGSFLLLVAKRHLQAVVASSLLRETASIYCLLVRDRYSKKISCHQTAPFKQLFSYRFVFKTCQLYLFFKVVHRAICTAFFTSVCTKGTYILMDSLRIPEVWVFTELHNCYVNELRNINVTRAMRLRFTVISINDYNHEFLFSYQSSAAH